MAMGPAFFLPFHTILADFLIQWTLSMAGHALSLQCLLSDVSYGHLSRNPMTKVVIGFGGLGDGEVGRRLLNLNGCNRSFLAKRPLFEAFLVSTCHRVLATALRMELSWLFAPFNCHALRSVLFVMAGGGWATALETWELLELCESTSLLGLWLWPPMTLDVLIPSALDITGDLPEALLDIQEVIGSSRGRVDVLPLFHKQTSALFVKSRSEWSCPFLKRLEFGRIYIIFIDIYICGRDLSGSCEQHTCLHLQWASVWVRKALAHLQL